MLDPEPEPESKKDVNDFKISKNSWLNWCLFIYLMVQLKKHMVNLDQLDV